MALEVIIITYQFMLEDFWKIMEERMCINFHKDNGDVKYVIIMPPHSDRNVQDFIFHSAVEVRKYFVIETFIYIEKLFVAILLHSIHAFNTIPLVALFSNLNSFLKYIS